MRLIFSAMKTSLIFRLKVRSWVRKAFLAYCWVMLEPPCSTPPPRTLANSARAMPRGLMPGSV